MIKMTFVLRRKPEISEAEFHRYWREEHGRLILSLKDALRYRRYVQSHTVRAGIRRPGGLAEPHDGIAELWWESMEEFNAMAASDAGRGAGSRITEDEARFIDFTRSSATLCEELVLADDA